MNEVTTKKDGRFARGEAMRVRLIEAAVDVFSRLGYSRATTKDIAKKAGVSPGLMFHYFASKEELLEAVIERYKPVDKMSAIVKETSELSASEGIKKCMHGLYDLFAERLPLVRIFLQEGGSNLFVKAAWQKALGEGIPKFIHYLNGLVASNQLRPHRTDVTARILGNAVVMFLITKTAWPGERISGHKLVEQFVDSILYGIANVEKSHQSEAGRSELDEPIEAFPPSCRGEIAMTLLSRFGSIAGVADAGINELKQIKGIGDAKAKLIWGHLNRNLKNQGAK